MEYIQLARFADNSSKELGNYRDFPDSLLKNIFKYVGNIYQKYTYIRQYNIYIVDLNHTNYRFHMNIYFCELCNKVLQTYGSHCSSSKHNDNCAIVNTLNIDDNSIYSYKNREEIHKKAMHYAFNYTYPRRNLDLEIVRIQHVEDLFI